LFKLFGQNFLDAFQGHSWSNGRVNRKQTGNLSRVTSGTDVCGPWLVDDKGATQP